MKKLFFNFDNSKGFTLIEVIISIIVASILGAMLTTYVTSTISLSTQNINAAGQHYYINSIMESIVTNYKIFQQTGGAHYLSDFKTQVDTQYVNKIPGVTVDMYYISFDNNNDEKKETSATNFLKIKIYNKFHSVISLFTGTP